MYPKRRKEDLQEIDNFFEPRIEEIYISPINPNVYKFISKIWTSFVNKMVSLTFNNDQLIFDHATFEIIQDSNMKIVAGSSQLDMKKLINKETPTDFNKFLEKTKPIPMNNKRNVSSYLLRKAILNVNAGEEPIIEFSEIHKDERIHPKIKKLITRTMNMAVGVPLFVKGSPIGVLWGVSKEVFNESQRKEIYYQLQSIFQAINHVIGDEYDGNHDAYVARRIVEKLDTTAQTFQRYLLTQRFHSAPVKSIIAHSHRYNKSYRLDKNYHIPTNKGFKITIDRMLPDEENDTNISIMYLPGFFRNSSFMYRIAREMTLKYGYKSFLVDVRGRNKHTLPDKKGFTEGWTIDDLIWEDFPTALKWINEKYPNDKIVIMGHSMGGMIPKFYASSFNKHYEIGDYYDLPDPSIIAGITAITSPSYIDLDYDIPGLEAVKFINQFIGSNFFTKKFLDLISIDGLTPFATIDLNKLFTFLHTLTSSTRLFSFNLLSRIPSLDDFIGYPNITPPEWYFLMEDVFCEESTKVIYQFVRAFITNNDMFSYNNTVNYTQEQRNLTIPLLSVSGNIDKLAPPEKSIKKAYHKILKNTELTTCNYDQGHLGILFDMPTVRSIAKEADKWIKNFLEK